VPAPNRWGEGGLGQPRPTPNLEHEGDTSQPRPNPSAEHVPRPPSPTPSLEHEGVPRPPSPTPGLEHEGGPGPIPRVEREGPEPEDPRPAWNVDASNGRPPIRPPEDEVPTRSSSGPDFRSASRPWARGSNGFKSPADVSADPGDTGIRAQSPGPPPPAEPRFAGASAEDSATVAVGPPGVDSASGHPPFAVSQTPPQAPDLHRPDLHPPDPHPPDPHPPDLTEPLADQPLARHPAAASHPLPRILAIANQKGGVGKTTTAVNLGAALAELDYRVLVVDLDPQGNATTGLGINGRNLDASIYDAMLHDVPVEDVIEPTSLRNLFVIPATIDLAGAEIELVPVFSRELRLRRALQPIESDFDFTIIDCPPSLGLLTINGLAAAGEVVVPIQCEYYALEGLGQLLRNVSLVQANLNSRLEVSTIVLTMYDARTKLAEQVAEEVRQHFGDRVCRSVVPRTVRLSEAPSFGQPIIIFDSSSRGSIAYRELAKEVSGGAPQRVR
jgi:chromosome partitioning protein